MSVPKKRRSMSVCLRKMVVLHEPYDLNHLDAIQYTNKQHAYVPLTVPISESTLPHTHTHMHNWEMRRRQRENRPFSLHCQFVIHCLLPKNLHTDVNPLSRSAVTSWIVNLRRSLLTDLQTLNTPAEILRRQTHIRWVVNMWPHAVMIINAEETQKRRNLWTLAVGYKTHCQPSTAHHYSAAKSERGGSKSKSLMIQTTAETLVCFSLKPPTLTKKK